MKIWEIETFPSELVSEIMPKNDKADNVFDEASIRKELEARTSCKSQLKIFDQYATYSILLQGQAFNRFF